MENKLENLKENIIEILSKDNYIPLDADELFVLLRLTDASDFTQMAKALAALEDEFVIAHNKKGCFALLKDFNLATGIIDVKEAGFGFVDLDEGSIFVKKDNLKGAITGDTVLVSTFKDKIGRSEGKVERIIQRGTTFVIGKLQKYRNKYVVRSVNSKVDLWIFIKSTDLLKAKENDFVRVDITKYYPNNTADGKVTSIIGNKNTPNIDITALIASSCVDVEFSEETKKEVKNIPSSVDMNKYLDRVNLTDKVIITIDGDDAKDLDDAVRVEKLDDGNYLLGVYIADVSEYVKENTSLNQDAYKRATSIYLPDRVIPMLPKELSNGICSLNEGVNRLVLACEMVINKEGHVLEHNIFEGVIKTTYRMTYKNVNEILENNNQIITKQYAKITEMLYNMKELSLILNDMRTSKGAFNFETNEAKVILNNQGDVLDIVLRKRGLGEEIIEEFMLIANETVANAMTWLDTPFIYRIHEEPKEDKIGKFIQILNNFNYEFKVKGKTSKAMSKALQEVLISLEKEDDIQKTIINNTLLRSMMKAKYSETNIGHYGLASDCYTHFTSPIRRYPDLLVHRLVKHYMLNKPQVEYDNATDYFEMLVHDASNVSSKQERKAESLERDATDLKKCEYMAKYIHETFTAVVSSITNWGIYVTLDNTVEGLVRFEDMMDDFYDIDELNARIIGRRSGNIYQMGDLVSVRLIDVNKEKRQISFKLLKKIKQNK